MEFEESTDTDQHKQLLQYCTDRYYATTMDSEIDELIKAKPECYVHDMFPAYREFRKSLSDESAMKIQKFESEAAQQLMMATFEEVLANAQGDQSRMDAFLKKLKSDQDAAVVTYAKFEQKVKDNHRPHLKHNRWGGLG